MEDSKRDIANKELGQYLGINPTPVSPTPIPDIPNSLNSSEIDGAAGNSTFNNYNVNVNVEGGRSNPSVINQTTNIVKNTIQNGNINSPADLKKNSQMSFAEDGGSSGGFLSKIGSFASKALKYAIPGIGLGFAAKDIYNQLSGNLESQSNTSDGFLSKALNVKNEEQREMPNNGLGLAAKDMMSTGNINDPGGSSNGGFLSKLGSFASQGLKYAIPGVGLGLAANDAYKAITGGEGNTTLNNISNFFGGNSTTQNYSSSPESPSEIDLTAMTTEEDAPQNFNNNRPQKEEKSGGIGSWAKYLIPGVGLGLAAGDLAKASQNFITNSTTNNTTVNNMDKVSNLMNQQSLSEAEMAIQLEKQRKEQTEQNLKNQIKGDGMAESSLDVAEENMSRAPIDIKKIPVANRGKIKNFPHFNPTPSKIEIFFNKMNSPPVWRTANS